MATIHREENITNLNKMETIFNSLIDLASRHKVVMPLHPATKKSLSSSKFSPLLNKISFVDPVGYSEMVHLELNSKLIVTDSGGVQKEAFFTRFLA